MFLWCIMALNSMTSCVSAMVTAQKELMILGSRRVDTTSVQLVLSIVTGLMSLIMCLIVS